MPAGACRDFAKSLSWEGNLLEYSSKKRRLPGIAEIPGSADVRFDFGDCVLDLDRRELARASRPISVGPQVFDVLVYLIQNRERVVSKDDLIEAVWRGRIVSDSTLTSHINGVRKAIGDSGEDQNLVRTLPRKGFRFIGEVTETPSSTAVGATRTASDKGRAPDLALPDRPSIAVLPFQNLSGDPDQEYFADGMVEDIIAALSRMRWLFVIARNSSFTYKGRSVDVKQVGRELGVRYVLEGSVRKAGNRVRIAGELIDASTGMDLWANRFEGGLDDIFDLQDRIAESVVGAITPKLEHAEIERAKRKPTENLDSYDYFLRGMASVYQRTREANDEALRLFGKAIDLDADFALAHGMAAWCYAWRKMNGWLTDRPRELAEASRLARRAVELGKDDAYALARGGHGLAFLQGDLETGLMFLDRALLLNPNLVSGWYLGGWLRAYYGEPEAAIEHLSHAMRLSPLDPTLYHMQVGVSFAHFLAGRFDDALSWAERALRDQPTYLPAIVVMAASNALGGHLDEAHAAMKRVREVDPALRVSNLKDLFPIRRPEDFAKWAGGLRKAGLPE
jgi:TolB-like protein